MVQLSVLWKLSSRISIKRRLFMPVIIGTI